MARRNLFNEADLVPAANEADKAADAPRRAGILRGPVAALNNDLLTNSQRDIEADLIDDDSPSDRLTIEDEGIAELREQIRTQGQIVPVMVRQILDKPGRYRIIYGRRRLAAIRGIPGLKVKALIRNLDDTQAIIAQGQENNARRDPSFIEKALFAAQLRASGYETPVILDALVTDKAMLSKMKSVTDVLPLDLVRVIGAAHGVGRLRWIELAELTKAAAPDGDEDLVARCFPEPPAPESTSEERLTAALAALKGVVHGQLPPTGPNSHEIRRPDGALVATIKRSSSAVDARVSCKAQPEFAAWFAANSDKIFGRAYEDWAKERGSD